MSAFSDYSTHAPVTPGRYLFACGEIEDVPEELTITEGPHGLIVHCPDLGPTPLDTYHSGLTDPKWLKLYPR